MTGSVVAIKGKNYTQNWVARACSNGEIKETPYVYSEKNHSIIGDVFFDNKRRAVPYAHYVANGSVGIREGAEPGVDLSLCPGFFPAFAYFHEYITEISTGLEMHVCEEVKNLYYNGLYISAFSVLELFLCDFLLCGVFSQENYYQKALVELKIKAGADQFLIEKSIKDTVFKQVFHRFDKIEKIFKAIFGFGFPDYRELKKQIFRRHNIVHRYSLSNQDRMTVCYASYDDVAMLIKTIVCFVEGIKKKCGL